MGASTQILSLSAADNQAIKRNAILVALRLGLGCYEEILKAHFACAHECLVLRVVESGDHRVCLLAKQWSDGRQIDNSFDARPPDTIQYVVEATKRISEANTGEIGNTPEPWLREFFHQATVGIVNRQDAEHAGNFGREVLEAGTKHSSTGDGNRRLIRHNVQRTLLEFTHLCPNASAIP